MMPVTKVTHDWSSQLSQHSCSQVIAIQVLYLTTDMYYSISGSRDHYLCDPTLLLTNNVIHLGTMAKRL